MINKTLCVLFGTLLGSSFGQVLSPKVPSLASFVPTSPSVDNSTFANTDYVQIYHQTLSWTVDMNAKTISGSVTHDFNVIQDTQFISLDAWNLTIQNVTNFSKGGSQLSWTQSMFGDLGNSLNIDLGQTYLAGGEVSVTITYTTSNTAIALTWLTAASMAIDGSNQPYMFSQSEDINGRSMIPMQDTPSIKQTYNACVTASSAVSTYMSANITNTFPDVTTTTTCFQQSIKIPSYLIAIAVGEIEYASLGGRCAILASPSMLQPALYEFANLNTYLDATEAYVGVPYVWGIYQLLVMPRSFPFGGMENPLMTFVSPTVVTGTRSQVYVVIHEIAHSWTGNMVTMNNWSDFWLNEGYTTFIERQVSARLYGGDFAKVEGLLGNTTIINTVQLLGANDTYATIHPVLYGDNPDNSFNEMPYEKGYQLLCYVQSVVGAANFQKYVGAYITQYQYQSITAYDQQRAFSYFTQDDSGYTAEMTNEKLSMINWSDWYFNPGVDPTGTLNFMTNNAMAAENLANAYIADGGNSSPTNYQEYNYWYSNLKVVFQNTLQQAGPTKTTYAVLAKIDADLSISETTDPEVLMRWCPTTLYVGWIPSDFCKTWVSSYGRAKYLNPVYIALMESGNSTVAQQWNQENINFYSNIAEAGIMDILNGSYPQAKTMRQVRQ